MCVFDQSASINCTVSNHHPLQERVQRNRVVLHHVVYKLHGSEIPVFRTFTDGLEPSSAEEKGEEEPCGGCVVAVITARSHTQSRKVWEATHTVEQGTTHTHTHSRAQGMKHSLARYERGAEKSRRGNPFEPVWEIHLAELEKSQLTQLVEAALVREDMKSCWLKIWEGNQEEVWSKERKDFTSSVCQEKSSRIWIKRANVCHHVMSWNLKVIPASNWPNQSYIYSGGGME